MEEGNLAIFSKKGRTEHRCEGKQRKNVSRKRVVREGHARKGRLSCRKENLVGRSFEKG